MQNLRRLGKNSGPILCKVRKILKRCRRCLVVYNPLPVVYIAFHSDDIGR